MNNAHKHRTVISLQLTNFIKQNKIVNPTFPTFKHDILPSHKRQLIIDFQNDFFDWLAKAIAEIRILNLPLLCFFL